MRLLCIKDATWYHVKAGRIVDGPKYGDEVTAIGEGICMGRETWKLFEWPDDDEGWQKSCFVPLSGEKEEIEAEIRELEHA